MMMSVAGYEFDEQYMTDDNVILGVDTDGKFRVRFRSMSDRETLESLEQLELAYLAARDAANINQLLLISCMILDFLCIHLFWAGYGRMSRLLAFLLLNKNGYNAGKYISFEEQINIYKAYYYEALRQSYFDWETGNNYYFSFIKTFFLCYICVIKSWINDLQWFIERKS